MAISKRQRARGRRELSEYVRLPKAVNTKSDYSTYWCPSHIKYMFEKEDKDLVIPPIFGKAYHQELQVEYMKAIPGYTDAFTEEIEAQLHYNENKNTKKSNPKGFYAARERLYAAREAVDRLIHTQWIGYPLQNLLNSVAWINNNPIKYAFQCRMYERNRELYERERDKYREHRWGADWKEREEAYRLATEELKEELRRDGVNEMEIDDIVDQRIPRLPWHQKRWTFD